MSFKIKTSDPFDAEVKRLSKKYRSLKLDLHELGKELMENPFQGVEIAPNIRKVRLAISSKGRGKSGGARVITYNRLTTLPPYFLLSLFRYIPLSVETLRATSPFGYVRDACNVSVWIVSGYVGDVARYVSTG